MANTFDETVTTLFKGMDSFMSTKTVVGEPMHVDGTIIIPLAEVSFGVGAGIFEQEKKNNGGGGLGGKIQPTALLVIQDGVSKLVTIQNNEGGLGRILDVVPDVIGKLTSKMGKKDAKEEKEVSAEVVETAANDVTEVKDEKDA